MPSIFCRFFKVIGEDLDTVVLTVNCIRPSQWKNIQFLWGLFKLFLYCWPNLLFGVVVKCLVPFSVLFVLLLPVPTWSCRPLHAQHHFGGGGSLQWRLRQEEQGHHCGLQLSSVTRGPFFHKVSQIVALLIPEALRDCFTITFYMRSADCWPSSFLYPCLYSFFIFILIYLT